MDQVFNTKDYGIVVIPDSYPQALKDWWYRVLGVSPTPVFVPTFRQAYGTDGQTTWSLNSEYFPTKPTAEYIAAKYGTGVLSEVPFGGSGGLFSASANEYWIELKDGRKVNAGLLAAYYVRNPEDKFPGLAEKLIRAVLGL